MDRDLALEDLLAGELSDGALSLGGGGKIDEGISNGTVGARVLRNRDGFTKSHHVSDGSTSESLMGYSLGKARHGIVVSV